MKRKGRTKPFTFVRWPKRIVRFNFREVIDKSCNDRNHLKQVLEDVCSTELFMLQRRGYNFYSDEGFVSLSMKLLKYFLLGGFGSYIELSKVWLRRLQTRQERRVSVVYLSAGLLKDQWCDTCWSDNLSLGFDFGRQETLLLMLSGFIHKWKRVTIFPVLFPEIHSWPLTMVDNVDNTSCRPDLWYNI